MKEFKDDQGRPWLIALTVASALRVRDLVSVDVESDETLADGSTRKVKKPTPFDLVDIGTIHQTLAVIRSSFAKLGEVLAALLIAQIAEKNLTKEQFLDGLRGESLEDAARALESEIVDFFPLRLRKMVAAMAAKFELMTAKILTNAMTQMESLDVDAAVYGTASGRLPESSESTPESGPTDNSSSLVTVA
jgi:hypothetical protein